MQGLVVSVKTAKNAIWSASKENTGLADCTMLKDCYNNISGLYNCNYIESRDGNFDNFPAFKEADEHGETCPVPADGKTTGWYLPAIGQVWDIYQNLGDLQQLADMELQTSLVDIKKNPDFKRDGLVSTLNKWMEKISSEGKDEFSEGYHQTSSEYDTQESAHYYLNANGIQFMTTDKTVNNHVVRPVLAF